MLEVVLTIPFWLELAATLSGGVFGALNAVRARYDAFGVVAIAIITGLSGGILRDVLLQNYGIYAFQKPTLLLVCAGAGFVVFYFGKLISYFDPLMDLLDNLAVALWGIIGAGKALSAGLDVVPAIILGMVTAVGGGIIADVCMRREPKAFHAGPIYGTAALLGIITFTLMKMNHILEQYAALSCVAMVMILRYGALALNLKTKPSRDYSDIVIKPMSKVMEKVRPPKGKIQRDKESSGYAVLLSSIGDGLKSLQNKTQAGETQALDPTTGEMRPVKATATASEHLVESDPSDRIVVNLDELHEFLDTGSFEKPAEQDGQSDNADPFEPKSKEPKKSPTPHIDRTKSPYISHDQQANRAEPEKGSVSMTDRIVVSREELAKIKDKTSSSEPVDPFEPKTPDSHKKRAR